MKRTFQCLIVMFLAIACGKPPESPRENPLPVSSTAAPEPGVEKKSSTSSFPNPETELMAQFKAFAICKRDYAKQISAEKNVKPPKAAWEMFEAAIDGDFAKTQKSFRQLTQQFRHGENGADVSKEVQSSIQPVWAPAMEVFGAMEAVDGWHAKFLLLYMRDVVESIPKGSIYFGGTDPGRFAITMDSKSHEKADPFFTITQNALADMGYMKYVRKLYGDRIYVPSEEDPQDAFRMYLESAKKRLIANRLEPGEDVTLVMNFQCPVDPAHNDIQGFRRSNIQQLAQLEKDKAIPCRQCMVAGRETMMPKPEPQVRVSGNSWVMELNALLAKTIFEKNPDHDFYLEESFPLPWMKPHMVPHGLIFKLERKPLKELHQAHIAKSRKDWSKYMALSVGDAVVKPETTVAELCKWVEKIYIKGNRENFSGDALFLKGKKEMMEKAAYRKGPPFSEQKAFSKMGVAQADLFAWRESTTQDAKLKTEYAKQSDFAFRQAFALGAINPEVAFKFSSFLTKAKRFEEARMVVDTFAKTEVGRNSAKHFYRNVLTLEEVHWVSKKEYAKAIAAVRKMVEIDGENKARYLERIEGYKKLQ